MYKSKFDLVHAMKMGQLQLHVNLVYASVVPKKVDINTTDFPIRNNGVGSDYGALIPMAACSYAVYVHAFILF
jgi:hypothetical protein